MRRAITALDQNLIVWEIWTRLIDENDADASCSTVHDYIRNRNHVSSSKIH